MELENYIKENWDKTARLAREDDNGNIGLPYRYFVPSIEGGFCNLFYWDSFFTAQGMFVHGKEELVKSTVDDMLYLIDCYGYMPHSHRFCVNLFSNSTRSTKIQCGCVLLMIA